MEQLGQKHTNYNSKSYKFVEGEWWYYYPENGTSILTGNHVRERVDVKDKRNNTRMWVDGKYIPKSHPLHKAGRYKGFTEAAFSSLENYETAKEGQVYIIVNPAFPSWCKIGMAVDAEDRLKQYQTSSPYRDYKLIATYDTSDRRKAEKFAHELLEKRHERRGEWFCIQHPVAASILELPMREFQ